MNFVTLGTRWLCIATGILCLGSIALPVHAQTLNYIIVEDFEAVPDGTLVGSGPVPTTEISMTMNDIESYAIFSAGGYAGDRDWEIEHGYIPWDGGYHGLDITISHTNGITDSVGTGELEFSFTNVHRNTYGNLFFEWDMKAQYIFESQFDLYMRSSSASWIPFSLSPSHNQNNGSFVRYRVDIDDVLSGGGQVRNNTVYFKYVLRLNNCSSTQYCSENLYFRELAVGTLCGNSTAEGSEECDGTTGCNSLCNCEYGYAPDGSGGCDPVAHCGDGIVQDPNYYNEEEYCDSTLGCSNTCQCDVGYFPIGGGVCEPNSECSTADGQTYYTQSVTAPLAFNGTWEYCSSGESPSNFSQTNGVYTWDCPFETGCAATNEYCGNSAFDDPAEECDSSAGGNNCTVSCTCEVGYISDGVGGCELACGNGVIDTACTNVVHQYDTELGLVGGEQFGYGGTKYLFEDSSGNHWMGGGTHKRDTAGTDAGGTVIWSVDNNGLYVSGSIKQFDIDLGLQAGDEFGVGGINYLFTDVSGNHRLGGGADNDDTAANNAGAAIIWAVDDNGDLVSGSVQQIDSELGGSLGSSDGFGLAGIEYLFEDSSGNHWIGGGAQGVNISRGAIFIWAHDEDGIFVPGTVKEYSSEFSLPTNDVFGAGGVEYLFEDSSGNHWLGGVSDSIHANQPYTGQAILWAVDDNGDLVPGTIKKYVQELGLKDGDGFGHFEGIQSLWQDGSGNHWIGGGIWLADPSGFGAGAGLIFAVDDNGDFVPGSTEQFDTIFGINSGDRFGMYGLSYLFGDGSGNHRLGGAAPLASLEGSTRGFGAMWLVDDAGNLVGSNVLQFDTEVGADANARFGHGGIQYMFTDDNGDHWIGGSAHGNDDAGSNAGAATIWNASAFLDDPSLMGGGVPASICADEECDGSANCTNVCECENGYVSDGVGGCAIIVCEETSFSMGDGHACTTKIDGTVRCWGSNNKGQLGNGTTTNYGEVNRVQVNNLTGAIYVDAGIRSTCAIKDDGTVRCWGWGDYGQLGDGGTSDSTVPVQVLNLTGATKVAVGAGYACALKTDETVRCWGNGSMGALGNGSTDNQLTPTQATISDVSDIGVGSEPSLGISHTCALKTDETVRCRGRNYNGSLGDGTTTQRNAPVQASGLVGVTAIAVELGHTCATKSDGTTWCWGGNGLGQLGDGTTNNSSVPVQVTLISDIALIENGNGTNCVLKTDGTVWCIGDGRYGKLGNGGTSDQTSFVQVQNLTGIQVLDGVLDNTCGIKDNGTVWCWGGNYRGQLGNGLTGSNNTVAYSAIPVRSHPPMCLVSCSTTAPDAHATACDDGGIPSSANQAGILTGTCSASVACDWSCDSGYVYDGIGLCVGECGNGIQEVPEECDDGNTVSGDGCSATCLDETCTYVSGSAGGVLEKIDFLGFGAKNDVGDINSDSVTDVIIGAVGDAASNGPFTLAIMIFKAISPRVADVAQIDDGGFDALITDNSWLGGTIQNMLDIYGDTGPDIGMSAYYDSSTGYNGTAWVVYDYGVRTCSLP